MSVMGRNITIFVSAIVAGIIAALLLAGILHNWAWLLLSPAVVFFAWASRIFEEINHPDFD